MSNDDSPRKATPMMERYLEVKAQYPDSLLLFRMGDFYELFYADAELAARKLGLTLTSRDKGSTNPIPMAGFPYHALDGYLQKLVRAGVRAAICEQMEDPKQAKGIVRREVTRVVTPGTLTEDSLLDPRETNYLACVYPTDKACGLAWLELSSGKFCAAELALSHVLDEIARLQPAECLYPESARTNPLIEELKRRDTLPVTERPPWSFTAETCRQRLLDQFRTQSLAGFDVDGFTMGIVAAGALLEYTGETQRSSLAHITRIEPYRRERNLLIDETTRRSLELTRTLRDGRREGSLLDVIDRTVTPMGARLLADWLSNPLTNLDEIRSRHDAVEEFVADVTATSALRDTLKEAYDLQRLTARVATGRCSPRDLVSLNRTLALLPAVKAKLEARNGALLQRLCTQLDLCPEVRAAIESTLVDEPPLQTTDGGMIREGFHPQLDEWRDLARGGKEWIANYVAKEISRTGIPNLKVGFNRVFGYYLETTSAQADKVPADYIRKQTLKNQERFITPELKEYEDKVLRAEGQAVQLEQELFATLREQVAVNSVRLRATGEALAEVDVLSSLAALATSGRYCRPQLTSEPLLKIEEGRHPVLDHLKPSGEFVPNDVLLGGERGRLQLITGPNMAGKSTYIRQAALLTILAQAGSFVPATKAVIGLADRVFARVGASDELGKGQSTFMVEMTETARILNTATASSLVILDEIGRGTSTYDGISLAWAITEFLHDVTACRTLFATHYHELTQLTQTLSGVTNCNVAVREQNDNVIFLHKIVEGAANKSYGIHVARLAGVPQAVLKRADEILETLETDHLDETGKPKVPPRKTNRRAARQLSLFDPEPHPLLDEIRQLNVNEMTPMAALQELHRLREKLGPEAQ